MSHHPYAHTHINNLEIEVVIGDIVQQPDIAAIINAANAQLLPGGGVCGAIFAAAGREELQAACRPLAPIQPGEAVLTPAFRLPNRAILHTCGPRYRVDPNPGELLAACYRNLLELAERHQLESLAIPAISTGSYGFPAEEAVRVCIRAVEEASIQVSNPQRIRFVVNTPSMARLYADYLRKPYPLSEHAIPLNLVAHLCPSRYKSVTEGQWGDMDTKWSMLFREPWLYIRRGGCAYDQGGFKSDFALRFVDVGGEFAVAESWANPHFQDQWSDSKIKDLVYGLVMGFENTQRPSCLVDQPHIVVESGPMNASEARVMGHQLLNMADQLDKAGSQVRNLITKVDRFRGCLLGLACGDAVGTTVEFRARDSFTPVTDMVGGGPFQLKPGEWTDDTSMALCLAASLVEQKGFDPSDQMRRYVRWMDEGYMSSNGRCFDVGIATRTALNRFKHNGDPFSGSTDPHKSGNGCIMRLAPVPMYAWPNRQLAIDLSGENARTTHGSPETIAASRLFGAILYQALSGAVKETILLGHGVHDLPTDALRAIANGDYFAKRISGISGNGYIVQSLEAALWCFWQTENFRDAILMATNLGDDADTTAAICGQVAGAYYGESGIPSHWIERLVMEREIRELADRLEACAPRRAPSP